MGFGRKIEGKQVSYWGARAIYRGRSNNYHIDLLPDRQGGENVSDGFLYWLNHRALPWLRQQVCYLGLGTDDDRVLSLTEFKYHIEACTNRSYGYLYIGAVERPVVEKSVWKNPATGVDERVFLCNGKTYIWDAFYPIPEPGTKGSIKQNNIGDGVLVGYHEGAYGDSGHQLLSLRVALDNPPKWWKDQVFESDLQKAIRDHVVASKSKWVGKGSRRELITTGEPDKESLKKFKSTYVCPPAIVPDGWFKAKAS